jgi:hypothetical protein
MLSHVAGPLFAARSAQFDIKRAASIRASLPQHRDDMLKH